MFTKNFYSLLMCNVNSGKYYTFTKYTGATELTGFNGVGITSVLGTVESNYTKTGVLFGNGNEPSSIDDYKLSGDIITTLSSNVSITRENDATELTAIYTLTNNSTGAITVGEVALNWGGYIMDRTTLDTPLVIEAGGTGQVTYTIRLNCPV